MSDGTTYTQNVYECSRDSATIQIDNTHWINEFSEGIELKKGDQVRLLGSFVQEGANSNEIEISEDQSINISFSPYILGDTIDTLDKSEAGNLTDLGNIGDIPYSTDAYGIEPPTRNTSQHGVGVAVTDRRITQIQNVLASGEGQAYPMEDGNVPLSAVPTPNRGALGQVGAYENQPMTNPVATGEQGNDIYGHPYYNPWMINSATQGQAPIYQGGTQLLDFNGMVVKNMRGDSAQTWGMNIKTDSFCDTHGLTGKDYKNFQENDVPQELYVGHMVKKFVLPVLDVFATGNTDADPTGATADGDWTQAQTHTLEDLLENAPASGQAGCLAGAPRVGMYIATVDLAQSSGWYDDTGKGYYENKWGTEVGGNNANFFSPTNDIEALEQIDSLNQARPRPDPAWRFAGASGNTGIPNLKSGVQSVIGEIIAVRPIKHHIMGRTQDCYEIYVSNFINPATIKGVNAISHTFNPSEVTDGESFQINNVAKTLYKKPHGGGTLSNGYNFNPSFNGINGALNKIEGSTATQRLGVTTFMQDGYNAGQNQGTPLFLSYNGEGNVNPLYNYKSGSYQSAYTNGGMSGNPSQQESGICNPEGLSFLWNGTHTGARKTKYTASNFNRFRANSTLEPYRETADVDNLKVRHLITDIIYRFATNQIPGWAPGDPFPPERTFTSQPIRKQQGSVPVCLGGYVICNRDTMLDIARGNLSGTPANNYYAQAGRTPRIWLDMGFQTRQSNYTTRHYVGNSWNTTGVITTTGDGISSANRFPAGGTTYHDEKRYGYTWLGRPNNINFRSSRVNDGNANPAIAQIQSRTFSVPAYTCQWTNNTTAFPCETDFTPLYLSTPTGAREAPDNASLNKSLPIINAGYNNCVNSIYFQQKDTGDTTLGLNSWRAKGRVVITAGVAGTNTLQIENPLTDIDTGLPRTINDLAGNDNGLYQIKVLLDNCQFNPTEAIDSITNTAPANTDFVIAMRDSDQTGGAPHNRPRWLSNIPIGTEVILYFSSTGGCGAGTTAVPWASDMIMIKESVAKFKVPAGYYTEEQLAERLNTELNYTIPEYARNLGTKDANNDYAVPTNVGSAERARASQPSVINGMFMQTYLPDVSYGFAPITTTNSQALEQQAQTKELTGELITYDPEFDGANFVYHWAEDIAIQRPYNGTTNRYITDHSALFPTAVGQHLKVYSVPYSPIIAPATEQQKEISLIRLRGGALSSSDFDQTTGRWGNNTSRWAGNLEILRATDICYWETGAPANRTQLDNPTWHSTQAQYAYKTRLTRNLFPYGGSARVICGANNPTISWEEGANRFSLNKLYTPLRPHQVESQKDPPEKSVDFGIDDAVPSALICAKHTGKIISQLTGVYINDLNANAFNQANWGTPALGDQWLYDIETNEQIETTGQKLLTILGYSATQVDAFNNSFNLNTDPFIYKDKQLQSGSAIRVGAKITPAVNASNPVASKCLNIAPVQQFFVQVDTDDFFAESVPLKGSSPYYFIGSNFPSKQFYGNLNGAKLPIVGICSRNFSAFNFVFDLGGSAISYLIDENTTITHIETKIYDSNLKTPTNLSPSSSVIYMITRYNYAKPISDPQEQQEMVQEYMANQEAPILNEFYSEPTASIRTAPPAIIPPQNSPYFTGFGTFTDIPTESDTDSD